MDDAIVKKTLGQILADTVAQNPDSPAVVYVDRDYRQTWREFEDDVDSLARGLMAMGVKKGDKVALWATNVPHWVTLQFATAKIGAILMTVNTNYRIAELGFILEQSDCENLVLIDGLRDVSYLDIVYELIPELRTQPRGNLRTKKFPHLKRVIFLGPEKHRGIYSINEVYALAAATSPDEYLARQAAVTPDDVVNMQYTSGTTGFPKGVQLTHVNIGYNGYWIGKNQNLSPADRVCIPVPLFHCFGCVLGVMACVNHGAAMVFLERYDPVLAMMSVEREKCTGLYGVPTMFIAILDHPLFEKFDFSTLRTGIMAGSPCPVKRMQDCVEKMNMREVTIVFGLTETSPGMTQTRYDEPSLEKKCSTVGKAMPHMEVKVIDPATGEECAPGVPGEMCVRGYNVMKGYYKMPEETARVIDKNGFLHSGDLGVMDEDGYFAITGRIKDLIIRGGENISPKEVEDFIAHIPGVRDVQVIGVPSKKYGEQVGAFIILQEGSDLTEEDIRDYCHNKIAWYKVPRFIRFTDSYPMTASGKIQKFVLRQLSSEYWPDA